MKTLTVTALAADIESHHAQHIEACFGRRP
jgi:hypothetical protein